MKRKHALMCGGAGLLVALLLAWSLVGAMTGIYRCPGATILDGSRGYLVRRGSTWCLVNIKGDLGDHVDHLSADRFTVEAGWWTATIVMRKEGTGLRAFAPYNLVDVADLVSGSRRDLGR